MGSLAGTEKRTGSKTAWDTPVGGTGKEDSEQSAKGTGGWPGGGRVTWRGEVLLARMSLGLVGKGRISVFSAGTGPLR